ncbi:P-loop containing nucleoside triphosphate hydrolases superfamily protein [Artemisia annua]|uniref:P-loop containing nucleoside triphosphate hydrolases superfamily protein n=1 Tax=Artemisia annua TaxID=35608 RepID=A0A2U1MJE6_ARTAN|nr:P-loop containing nucleoside triphosphate hydrolases superfamily protein [Artemisia annua]
MGLCILVFWRMALLLLLKICLIIRMGDSIEFAGELYDAMARRWNIDAEDGLTKDQVHQNKIEDGWYLRLETTKSQAKNLESLHEDHARQSASTQIKWYVICEIVKESMDSLGYNTWFSGSEVIELKGNIRVFCRCRPLKHDEIAKGSTAVVDFDSSLQNELKIIGADSSKKQFKFDHIFRPEDNQEAVFAQTSPLVVSVLDGFNVCIFAYGQTGTGKTFTMEGTTENRGVNCRTLEELFRVSEERSDITKYQLFVSMLEVYNEKIRDLLVEDADQPAKKLEVKQSAEGTQEVPRLSEVKHLCFVQISPSSADLGETVCSRNFASRVRGVDHGPARKQTDATKLFKYKQLVDQAASKSQWFVQSTNRALLDIPTGQDLWGNLEY